MACLVASSKGMWTCSARDCFRSCVLSSSCCLNTLACLQGSLRLRHQLSISTSTTWLASLLLLLLALLVKLLMAMHPVCRVLPLGPCPFGDLYGSALAGSTSASAVGQLQAQQHALWEEQQQQQQQVQAQQHTLWGQQQPAPQGGEQVGLTMDMGWWGSGVEGAAGGYGQLQSGGTDVLGAASFCSNIGSHAAGCMVGGGTSDSAAGVGGSLTMSRNLKRSALVAFEGADSTSLAL